MSLLLLIWALAAPNPTFWAERDGTTLRCNADLRAMGDAALEEKLRSGLTTTLRLHIQLVHIESEEIRGQIVRRARARWDLWDEALYVELEQPGGGVAQSRFTDAGDFLSELTAFKGSALAREIPITPAVYKIQAVLKINPLPEAQLAQTRRWMWANSEGGLDPLARGLFGSFVRLFENLKTGAAERTLKAEGAPFRADRLPFYSPARDTGG